MVQLSTTPERRYLVCLRGGEDVKEMSPKSLTASLAAVVLAAGESTRMGTPKQLLELGGRPMLQHVVDAAVGAGLAPVIVVLGHEAGRVEAALELARSARAVVNPEYRSGQASSLRAGLDSLGDEVDAAVILLGDQPDVTPEIIARVVESWRASGLPIARACSGGAPGHPVVVDRSEWPAWRRLTGDEGARRLIARHPERAVDVDLAHERPSDIDTPADFARLLSGDRWRPQESP